MSAVLDIAGLVLGLAAIAYLVFAIVFPERLS